MPIFDRDFVSTLDRLSVNLQMHLTEGMSGGRKSKAKGSSAEFSDYREYSIGDDFRRIDWNAYGRFERLFVKLFNEEREALIHIFMDGSKSMDFGIPKKSLQAQKTAAALAFLAFNTLDRVRIVTLGGSATPYLTGRSSFSRACDFLEQQRFEGMDGLLKGVRNSGLKSKGLSVVISDFLVREKLEDLLKYLLYQKQEVILVQVLSREELWPTLEGQVRLVDSETKEVKDIALSPSLLRAYETHAKAYMDGLQESAKKFGATFVQIFHDEPFEKVIFEDFLDAGIVRQVVR